MQSSSKKCNLNLNAERIFWLFIWEVEQQLLIWVIAPCSPNDVSLLCTPLSCFNCSFLSFLSFITIVFQSFATAGLFPTAWSKANKPIELCPKDWINIGQVSRILKQNFIKPKKSSQTFAVLFVFSKRCQLQIFQRKEVRQIICKVALLFPLPNRITAELRVCL